MAKHEGINGRVATQADVDANECVFYIPDGASTPYQFETALPISAIVTKPDDGEGFPSPGTRVQIVQAEVVDGDVVLGILYGDSEGVCSLEDVEIV